MNNNNIKKQEDFQKLFNQPVLTQNEVPTIGRRELRLNLALEELYELAEAYGLKGTFNAMLFDKVQENSNSLDTFEYNAVEVLDALCDIEVINNGTILESGFGNVYNNAYEEVHNSNMSKACETEEEAQKTIDFYAESEVYDVTREEINYESSDGGFLVKRSDGKVLKSINYKKAELKQFIEDGKNTESTV